MQKDGDIVTRPERILAPHPDRAGHYELAGVRLGQDPYVLGRFSA
jgi:hypothetical protein